MITQSNIDQLEGTFAAKTDLKESLTSLKSDIFDKLDSFVGETKNTKRGKNCFITSDIRF